MHSRYLESATIYSRRGAFITGYAENAVLSNGHLAPGMSVMTKPFAIEAMAARIKALMSIQRVTGASRFNSSIQFRTTTICVRRTAVASSTSLSIRKRPSAATS